MELELFAWAHEVEDRGAGEILFTSMNHDGTKNGYANEALARLSDELSIPIIASGGAGTKGEIPIPELKKYLSEQCINVRI